MQYCIIEVLGGGGGGAGNIIAISTSFKSGSGGGAGGYAKGVFSASTIGVSQSVIVGAGGAGGASANGSAGGTTSVGTLIQATGGGGATMAVSTESCLPGIGGVGSGGSLNANGASGGIAFDVLGQELVTGAGANSIYGGGGVSRISDGFTASVDGVNATNYGAGGSGGSRQVTGPTTGGNGSPGIVIITEFIS